MVKITKKGKKAWVTFTVEGNGSEDMKIQGSWNEWEPENMKKKKNGDFYLTKILKTELCYEFGYLNSEGKWVTDSTLPHVSSPYGSENSVLEL